MYTYTCVSTLNHLRRFWQVLFAHLLHVSCAICARVMCQLQSVQCVGFSQSHVRLLVCAMCRIESVLFAGCSLCYMRDLVGVMCRLHPQTPSLRSEQASCAADNTDYIAHIVQTEART